MLILLILHYVTLYLMQHYCNVECLSQDIIKF